MKHEREREKINEVTPCLYNEKNREGKNDSQHKKSDERTDYGEKGGIRFPLVTRRGKKR